MYGKLNKMEWKEKKYLKIVESSSSNIEFEKKTTQRLKQILDKN